MEYHRSIAILPSSSFETSLSHFRCFLQEEKSELVVCYVLFYIPGIENGIASDFQNSSSYLFNYFIIGNAFDIAYTNIGIGLSANCSISNFKFGF